MIELIVKMQGRLLVFLAILIANLNSWGQPASVMLSTGAGTTLGTFNSLAAAYAAIPNPMVSPVTIEMLATYTGAIETLPLTFSERPGASSTNTITIRPGDSATSIVHSAIIASNAVIVLDGADWLILDGRPGGVGSTRAWTINNLAGTANTLSLRNGATNNQLRYLVLQHSGAGSASSCLHWGTSPTQTQGNSFNLAEHNLLIGSRYGFHFNGTAANRNHSNIIRQNEITTVYFSGIWVQAGTGGITIDSNIIYSTNAIGTGPFGIILDSPADTAVIVNNHIYGLNGGASTSAIRGISIRSNLSSGFTGHSLVANNFVSLSLAGNGSTSVVGIEYSGAGLFNARIYNNTVRIGGTLGAAGTSGSVLSAAFAKIASNTGSVFDLRNNLLLNARTGGFTGGQHVAIWLSNTAGALQFNHNTYNSADLLARVADTAYNSFSNYVAVLPVGSESQGNTRQVVTMSTTNLQLTGSSLGDTLLGAPAIQGINRDLLGNQRHPLRVYRGAHEATPTLGSGCTGMPTVGVAAVNSSNVCAGDSLTLSLSLPINSDWQYQWQFSTAGGPYVNIPNATSAPLRIQATLSRSYRCLAVCPNSGLTDTSNAAMVSVDPVIGGVGISATPAGFSYTFTANAAAGATQFQWNFDDGSTDTGRVVSHTFGANRQHNVRVVASNSCFTDSASLPINITGVSVTEQRPGKVLRIWPNPAGEQIFVEADFEVRHLQLLSVSGAVMRSWEASADRIHAFSLGDLAPGFYLLRAEGKRGESITEAIQRLR